MTKLTLMVLMISAFQAFSQKQPLELEAKRTKLKVIIDGKLDDAAWKEASPLGNLIEFRPTMGKKERPENRSEMFLMYSDEGIYFGGHCFESTPDSIARELVGRDGFGTNDYVGITFDTYGDKLNGFEYFLTPLGEQWDAKVSSGENQNNGGEDFNWNAVWKSGAVIHDKGWDFEMFLPYAAIRFGKDKVQDWGMNITRRRRKTEQQYTWNPIDVNVNGYLTQAGKWKGLTDIKPPLRLQLYPYFSFYQNHFPLNSAEQPNWQSNYSGGLDLKLGISQAFTLDATLIPDFGQVQSDNKVLNLTPFEVKFNENRTFFTEGTELFSKGDLFYSRRIGGQPINLYAAYDDVKANETLLENPNQSKLINASKISGRTQSGLGIGILNAITKAQFATIKNNETGDVREFETDPTTNYNLLVFDQTLKNNSSVSFINTNVTRQGDAYNANVSSGLFSFSDKKNTYKISGNSALSHLNYKSDEDNSNGYSHNINFSKSSGQFQFQIWNELTDTKFTSNDLGYFTNNNFINNGFYMGYRITKPKNWYNRMNFNFNTNNSRLFSPIGDIASKHQAQRFNVNWNSQTKKLLHLGVFSNYQAKQNDFYEPRQLGKVFHRGPSLGYGFWVGTNDAKKYSVNVENFARSFIDFYNLFGIDNSIYQNFRVNSKFSINHGVNFETRTRGLGYNRTLDDNTTIFAIRKVNSVDNTLTLKYNFTNKMGLNWRTRHYVSKVSNKEFFTLEKSGDLTPNSTIKELNNQNVNFFNVDMVYTWQVAPGSFLNIVWKNATSYSSDKSTDQYFKNLKNTLQADQNNNLSFKLIYFLDYLTIKNFKKSKG